jgi:hypothetical protein
MVKVGPKHKYIRKKRQELQEIQPTGLEGSSGSIWVDAILRARLKIRDPTPTLFPKKS